jgi:hypothetical protein
MGIEATGKVYAIDNTVQVSDRFSKRQFVLELGDNPKYPQFVAFEFTGDKCSVLDEFSVGDEVTVQFNLRGREWRSPKGETKYFNTLNAWSLNRVGEQRVTQRSARGGVSETPAAGGAEDEIPFASCSLADEPSPIALVLR